MTILPCPPKDWKRPPMPIGVKLDVVLRQTPAGKLKTLALGLKGSALAKIKLLLPAVTCPVTGEPIGDWANIRFDHRPALWERSFYTMTNDTIPPSNSVADIEALSVKGHDIRTHGKGGEKRVTTVGSDSHRRAKIARFEDPKPKKGPNIRGRSSWPTGRKIPKRQKVMR